MNIAAARAVYLGMDIRRWAFGALLLAVLPTLGCNEGLPSAPAQPQELTVGTPVTLSGAMGSSRTYRVNVPVGSGKLRILLGGFSGDADLIVRFNAEPTTSAFDCVSESAFALEECIFDAPSAGTWYIQVFGYSAFSGAQLAADLFPQTGERSLSSGVAVTGLTGASGGFEMFRITVPSGTDSLAVALDVTGDADLYLGHQLYPLLNAYDCASFTDTGSERCVILTPAAGTWMIRVDAYRNFSAGTLRATLFPAPAAP